MNNRRQLGTDCCTVSSSTFETLDAKMYMVSDHMLVQVTCCMSTHAVQEAEPVLKPDTELPVTVWQHPPVNLPKPPSPHVGLCTYLRHQYHTCLCFPFRCCRLSLLNGTVDVAAALMSTLQASRPNILAQALQNVGQNVVACLAQLVLFCKCCRS